MTSSQFFDLTLSLSLQTAVVIVVAHWLSLTVNSDQTKCHIWAACHWLLLLLIGVGLLVPHLRIAHPTLIIDQESAAAILVVEQKIGRIVFLVWGVGCVIALFIFVVRSIQMNRFLQTCQEVDLTSTGLDHLGDSLVIGWSGHGKSVKVLKSSAVAGPFCWQFHRPYIVLPEYLFDLDPQQAEFIIRHEVAHLQSGHPVQLFVQRVVEMIFWFHPMVWWSSHQSALAREFACDTAAVESRKEISAYLQTLLAVIQAGADQSEAPSVSIPFGRGKTIIAKRAERLVELSRCLQPKSKFRLSGTLACACLTLFVLSIGLVRLPVDIMASPQSTWSPWPRWSASVLHDFGIHARDFETYDHGIEELGEILRGAEEAQRIH